MKPFIDAFEKRVQKNITNRIDINYKLPEYYFSTPLATTENSEFLNIVEKMDLEKLRLESIYVASLDGCNYCSIAKSILEGKERIVQVSGELDLAMIKTGYNRDTGLNDYSLLVKELSLPEGYVYTFPTIALKFSGIDHYLFLPNYSNYRDLLFTSILNNAEWMPIMTIKERWALMFHVINGLHSRTEKATKNIPFVN